MTFDDNMLPTIDDPAVNLVRDERGLFGEDALLLAAAGFHVQLFEHDPVIAALLADGLARAAADPQLSPIVARMRLTSGDSVQALTARASMDVAKPDVVYLDPMFPARQKSAAVKKKFQLLHRARWSSSARRRARTWPASSPATPSTARPCATTASSPPA